MSDRMSLLQKEARAIGVELSDKQLDQFENYYELLVKWNEVMNLTAITEFEQVMTKHFVDSITLIKAIEIKNSSCLIDVGTGAGFPGIPLKIAFPEIKIVLLDSLRKRVGFLDEVIKTLELQNISTVHGRAEDFGKNPEYRENFDFAVSRAVANLSSLSEYCIPFVKVGGSFISYKSGNIDEELQLAKGAIGILGGKLEKVEKFALEDAKRSLIVIGKKKPTPKKFPRKAGTPAKEPLK